jgi:prolyl oligopeptidase
MRLFPLLCCFFSISAMAQTGLSKDSYPKTKTTSQQDVFFGTTVKDPYRWLENDNDPGRAQWIKEENQVTDSYLSKIPFRNALRDRLKEVYNYEKYSAPFREGNYTYFFKNNGLQNQSVLYRQHGNEEPEVFLDPNTFSPDGTTALTNIDFTKDGSLCAYAISKGGSDWGEILIMDARTKQISEDTIRDVKFSNIGWKGNEGFFYSTYDKPNGSQLTAMTDQHKLYFHKLNTPQSSDVLIFGGAATPRRYISGYVTEDQKYLVITAAKATYGNELYIKDLSSDQSPITPVVSGFDTEQRIVCSANGKLYIITNRNAPNNRLVVTDATTPTSDHWKDLIPEGKFPLSVSTGGNKLFAHYIQDAVSKVYQYSLDGQMEKEIALPGLGTASGFSAKKEETDIYYTFSSYIYPPTIFRYDLSTGTSTVFKKANVAFNPNEYESQQVFYKSKDGTRIPMIITHKKGIELNGKNPTILYGYGGFGISLTPAFSISNVVFMENGGVYAVPNLRGGGEYGEEWHRAGTKMQKQHVFDDFIAAAEFLIRDKVTSPQYLAISGGSNGGLLVGACMTQRPDLFRVALPAVGVLDMLRYHKFTAGAGWAYDYGTADDSKEMFQYLLHYSPLHNVRAGTCYPSTLITTGDHDDRVVPAHSFKFAATLQSAQNCNHPVLIRIETRAGHGAGKPTSMIIEETADRLAFTLYEMGATYLAPNAKKL